ncbi:pyridine nucleotide-disulfide oxidoreductase [Anopheles sinensis]|uniref:Pyridine nucleotide-disulfide oxidoreductase n=1 Tax=Anopheles sinensis TaxID=74873 RepID=A0A084WH42_ANOSI|nr:pyridine nucleotide-disulfide oxidoreductase [Anopheles sinensis]
MDINQDMMLFIESGVRLILCIIRQQPITIFELRWPIQLTIVQPVIAQLIGRDDVRLPEMIAQATFLLPQAAIRWDIRVIWADRRWNRSYETGPATSFVLVGLAFGVPFRDSKKPLANPLPATPTPARKTASDQMIDAGERAMTGQDNATTGSGKAKKRG